MTGCVYHLCILCALLSGIYASWIVHSKSATWAKAGATCVSNNQTLMNRFDEQMIRNLTSCVNKEDLSFWTGGYTGTSLTDWIAFLGCVYVNNQTAIIRKENQSHTVSSCYQFCRNPTFGLTINSCVCFGNVAHSRQTYQKTNYCIHDKEEFMGINGSMAIYKYVADPAGAQKASSQVRCSFYYCYGNGKYYSRHCKNTTRFRCENGFSSREAVTWDEAVRACLNKGSFLQATIPDKGCSATSSLTYWSYVRRFREHNYVTGNTHWSSNIIECETLHLNRGSIAFERKADCQSKQLPYVCQSVDDSNIIYKESVLEPCNSQNVAVSIAYTSSGPQSSPVSGGPRKDTTTIYHETTPTHGEINESTLHTRSHLTSEDTNKTNANIGLIAGVVAGCVVAVVAVVVILVFCRKASRKKNDNAENKKVPPASKPAYDSWLYANTSANSAKEREVTVDENNSICDIELYDVSGEGDYDHLRSNNRRIKKEADYMYDTTAQVKAEEEMYSSTRKGNSYVESSDFYDSMQNIKNEGEDLYDHSMTASNYSQTSLYSMAQYGSDPTEF